MTSNTPRTWADIDFSGCYPTAITLVPKIDLVGTTLERKATLVIDAETTNRLLHEGLTPNMVRDLKSALNTSNEAFFLKLFRLKNRRLAARVRQICERPDNTLIEDWLKRCRVGHLGRCLIAGFAKIRFSFPVGTCFPCLPVSHEKYGLVYPLSGETCVTAAEVVLALEAGAMIDCLWAIELPVEMNEDGIPNPLLYRHLREVMCERKKYADQAKKGDAAAVIYERLLKEFANSFYGKFAQGINVKSATDDTTGLTRKMPPSRVTEPCVAALATGFARAALSAAMLAVNGYNQGRESRDCIMVASCTTDGLLIGLPADPDFSVLGDYYQQVASTDKTSGEVHLETHFVKKPSLPDYLTRFGCEGLMHHFDEYLPLRLMRQARLDLVGQDDYIEIKHLADYVVSIKTRGQLGFLNNDDCTIIARFGHRVPLTEIYKDPEEYKKVMTGGGCERATADAAWLMGRTEIAAEGGPIETYPHITLETYKTILASEGGKDLTSRVSDRRVNADFDWKRDLQWADKSRSLVSPFTVPHHSLAAMIRKRSAMEAIRRRGENAPAAKVLNRFAVREKTIRYSGGVEASLVREALRAVYQSAVPATLPENYRQCADAVTSVWRELGFDGKGKSSWTPADINNVNRPRSFEPGTFPPETGLLSLADRLSDVFAADRAQLRQLLFTTEMFQYHVAPFARDVAVAILNGHRLGIAPFPALAEAGLLPARSRLIELFGHLVPSIDLIPANDFPNKRGPSDRQMINQLFMRAGLPAKSARLATNAIVTVIVRERQPRSNPSEKRCLETFVRALHQPDLVPVRLESPSILGQLRRFGLTKSMYYRLRSEKFVGKSLRRTPENRRQIEKMALALKLDPARFADSMIE